MSIFVTSDLHFNHNKDFVYEKRGFSSVYEMNSALIKNWNSIITEEDHVYMLGDFMLGSIEEGLKLIKQLRGNIHIIRGNHDTESRIEAYKQCFNIIEICDAKYLKYNKHLLFLSHAPCIYAYNNQKKFEKHILNLFGHTHQNTKFYTSNNEINPFLYNVGVDAHLCTPILLDECIDDMKTMYSQIRKVN